MYDKYGYRKGWTFGGGVKYMSFKLDIADDTGIYEFNKGTSDAQRNMRFAFSYVF